MAFSCFYVSILTLQLIISLTFFCNVHSEARADKPTYVDTVCSGAGDFSPNSTYKRNLDAVISSLNSSDAADYIRGFGNATAGHGHPDQVYGLFLCRGDVGPKACRDCVSYAGREILLPGQCPVEKTSIIWYEECMLSYSDKSIFSTIRAEPMFRSYNLTDTSINNTIFVPVLEGTLVGLLPKVSKSWSGEKFAVQKANVTASQTLYVLGQCTPDLTTLDCSTCLQIAVGQLIQDSKGAAVFLPSCLIWYEMDLFYNETAVELLPESSPAFVDAPVPQPGISKVGDHHHRFKSKGVLFPCLAMFLLINITIAAFIILRRRRRRKQKKVKDKKDTRTFQFNLNVIRAATDDFSDENKLGQGGFGKVYRGKLENVQEIAVKRLERSSAQGREEFKNEIVLMARLEHQNLVKLHGFCSEAGESLLIYEFVPNSSLDKFLTDPAKRALLNWDQRLRIIKGVAWGLLYLHEDSGLRIIHRDLKPGNILLDDELNPRIADFGMARLFNMDQSKEKTRRIMGTYGYMAPEYAVRGVISVRTDVYCFGVIVLEIITGKKIAYYSTAETLEHLVSNAWKAWMRGRPLALVDPFLKDGSRSEIQRCIHIALLCVQEKVASRPTMASIVLKLSSHNFRLTSPSRPSFLTQESTKDPNTDIVQLKASQERI